MNRADYCGEKRYSLCLYSSILCKCFRSFYVKDCVVALLKRFKCVKIADLITLFEICGSTALFAYKIVKELKKAGYVYTVKSRCRVFDVEKDVCVRE